MLTSRHRPVPPVDPGDPFDRARAAIGTITHEPVAPNPDPADVAAAAPTDFRHVLRAAFEGALVAPPASRLARFRAFAARTDMRMMATVGWLPVCLAVSTVVGMYLLSVDAGLVTAPVAPLAYVLLGLAVGLLLWVVGAAATDRDALPERANPRSYADLVGRMSEVEATIVCRGAAGQIAQGPAQGPAGDLAPDAAPIVQLSALKARLHASPPDADWASGMGYVNAWRDLHRIEEALIASESPSEFSGTLRHDELRVEGSKLDRKDSKVRELIEEARRRLDGKPAADDHQGRDDGEPAAEAALGQTASDPEADMRSLLTSIRQAVNDFRDRRFEALVRNRIYVDRVSLLLGLAAWALLCLAILVGAEKTDVVGASALYLIGAAAGLFTQLRSGVSESLEDVFGYGQAQLRRTVLMSGLAGVGGVFLTAVVGAVADGGASSATPLSIAGALEFTAVAAVTAAVFGLAPGMLTDQLTSWAKTSLKELESTTTAASGQAGEA